jgi:hypothetical protein
MGRRRNPVTSYPNAQLWLCMDKADRYSLLLGDPQSGWFRLEHWRRVLVRSGAHNGLISGLIAWVDQKNAPPCQYSVVNTRHTKTAQVQSQVRS